MKQRHLVPLRASVGFAADAAGRGLAFTRVRIGDGEPAVLRTGFRVRRLPGLAEREIAYAAVRAVALDLRRRGGPFDAVLQVADERLVADLQHRPALPGALTVPYVALGCALNALGEARVVGGASSADPGDDDATVAELTARARAEIALRPIAA